MPSLSSQNVREMKVPITFIRTVKEEVPMKILAIEQELPGVTAAVSGGHHRGNFRIFRRGDRHNHSENH